MQTLTIGYIVKYLLEKELANKYYIRFGKVYKLPSVINITYVSISRGIVTLADHRKLFLKDIYDTQEAALSSI